MRYAVDVNLYAVDPDTNWLTISNRTIARHLFASRAAAVRISRHFHTWVLVSVFGQSPRRECECGAVESVSLGRVAQMVRAGR